MGNRRKYIIVFSLLIVICVIFIFLGKVAYKINKSGNNFTNKTLEEVENYILNISSYSAKIEITVKGNKTTNTYVINQEYSNLNISKQEIIEPTYIKSLKTVYDGENLKIFNSDMELSKIYNNYEYIVDNILWLNSFINDYKNSNDKNMKETNGEIIMQVKVNKNKYVKNKILYIDKNTGKPTKLIVEDDNKNNIVYIKYIEIEINNTNKEEILAFTLNPIKCNEL